MGHAVPPPLAPICSPRCEDHPEHVYVVCYRRPVVVNDRDYLVGEQVFDYPISHYVGYTSGLPVRRLWTHGAKSSRHVVAVVPGDEHRENMVKELEACPSCSRSLWYYGESPRPLPLLGMGDVVTRGERGRVRYRVGVDAQGAHFLQRLDSEVVLSTSDARRVWPSLVVRERNPDGYRARQQERQAALTAPVRHSQTDLERLRRAAYRAVQGGYTDVPHPPPGWP